MRKKDKVCLDLFVLVVNETVVVNGLLGGQHSVRIALSRLRPPGESCGRLVASIPPKTHFCFSLIGSLGSNNRQHFS